MESSTQTAEATTPTKQKKAIRVQKLYALIEQHQKDKEGATLEAIETIVIEAISVRDLKDKLTDPAQKILAVFKGRKLEFKTQQQISLKLN